MVLDQPTGHKATTRRFLEEDRGGDRVHEYGELCTADYVEHDPAMPHESVGGATGAARLRLRPSSRATTGPDGRT
ncbi:hypothetical protein [Actinomadura macra]|uniref:hypothetical protein n=1 Tax=Actinomadura macra TaxID=46164 RepID=UPI000829BAAF|nr:hypothetical protein [Actinomadura macra]